MKRFAWRLQKVLDIKAKEEQLRQAELFRLTQILADRRSELLLRQQILQEIMAEISTDGTPQRLGAQEFFLTHAITDDQCIARLRSEIQDVEIRHKEKIAEVLTLKRFKEGLEKLRAEAKERFIAEQEKLEQKELDDGTTIAFARSENVKAVHSDPSQSETVTWTSVGSMSSE